MIGSTSSLVNWLVKRDKFSSLELFVKIDLSDIPVPALSWFSLSQSVLSFLFWLKASTSSKSTIDSKPQLDKLRMVTVLFSEKDFKISWQLSFPRGLFFKIKRVRLLFLFNISAKASPPTWPILQLWSWRFYRDDVSERVRAIEQAKTSESSKL